MPLISRRDGAAGCTARTRALDARGRRPDDARVWLPHDRLHSGRSRSYRSRTHLYLCGSYLLRTATGPVAQQRKDYQRAAAKSFLQAMAAGEIDADTRG
jgi:hypothetical protein